MLKWIKNIFDWIETIFEILCIIALGILFVVAIIPVIVVGTICLILLSPFLVLFIILDKIFIKKGGDKHES